METQNPQTPSQPIIIYVCPTPGCGNYYAAPDFRVDLNPGIVTIQTQRGEDGEQVPSWSRVECPACRARGIRVARVPKVVVAMVDAPDAMRYASLGAIQ